LGTSSPGTEQRTGSAPSDGTAHSTMAIPPPYELPRKVPSARADIRLTPLFAVGVVHGVGMLTVMSTIDDNYPYGMSLAASLVSGLCFMGFLGLRSYPSGRPSWLLLGISTASAALLFAGVVVATHPGDGLMSRAPYFGVGFALAAMLLGFLSIDVLRRRDRSSQASPPQVATEGEVRPGPVHLFDTEGIVLASILTAVVPTTLSLIVIVQFTAVGGVPFVCPAALLAPAIYMGIAALRKGVGLYWTILTVIILIVYGLVIVLIGWDSEYWFTLLGLLVLVSGLIAALAVLADAYVSHRMFVRG